MQSPTQLWGTNYSFQGIERDPHGGLTAVFTRQVGSLEHLIQEPLSARSVLTTRALEFYMQAEESPQTLKIGTLIKPLYPEDEITKAIEAFAKIPGDILRQDSYIATNHRNPHKWPFKPWGYRGLQLVSSGNNGPASSPR